MGEKLLSGLITYHKVNQENIFITDQNESGNTVLKLVSCYAYDRKKFLEKEILVGEGLVGQVFMERKYIFLTRPLKDYIKITSG